MERAAVSSIRVVQHHSALFFRWSRFISEVVWKGDTGDTKLDIFLFLSDFARKPVLLGVVAELLLQVQIILMGISRREMEGPALGCLR